jgi:hypothetical protein
MTHPIIALQAALVGTLRAELDTPIFDAPPKETAPPYIVIARHDVRPRDGDGAPGHEHSLRLHVWAAEASRKSVLAIADEVIALALALDSEALTITLRRHDRTDSAIDTTTGRARAAIALTYFTEPS